jgi:hypothetical protein
VRRAIIVAACLLAAAFGVYGVAEFAAWVLERIVGA